ncbi:MAG: hypothetical protein U0W65_05245 [Bacteroidia bacterium]
MKELITKILSSKEFIEKPPVLVDIGASGQLIKEWELIAKYSICIAFEADNREFTFIEKENDVYKKLYVFNCIVSSHSAETVNFYLTKSPYCSSTLNPDIEALKNYLFHDSFVVESETILNSININEALAKSKIGYIDWFKTDSQGTDLRLFDCLSEETKNKTIVGEFEPGIIKGYLGEDKLYDVLKSLEKYNFWVSDIIVKGDYRLKNSVYDKYIVNKDNFHLKKSPGWAEVSFINNYSLPTIQSKRNYLLGWIFSSIKNQHGFALELANSGFEKYNDALFKECINYSLSKLQPSSTKRIVNRIKTRVINKLLYTLHNIES